MSFLARVEAANRFSLDRFTPFTVAGRRLGYVHDTFKSELSRWPETFAIDDDGVALAGKLDSPDCSPVLRTETIDATLRAMRSEGLIPGWREERYAVRRRPSAPALFFMERAALALFGLPGCGVHVNGYVRGPDGALSMWIARRSRTKQSWPGLLDQVVAGGQPHGIGIRENVVKECWEEAAIERGLAARAVPVGVLTYVYGLPLAVRPDTAYCFDLELPADFQPQANDGEVESFELMPIEDVAARVRDTEDFKFNCALVIIDFLVRHGLIEPDHADYVDICEGLRGGAAAGYFDD